MKSKMKRLVSLILCAAMVMGLAACGGKNDTDDSYANSELAKQGVCSYENLDFSEVLGSPDYYDVNALYSTGDMIYALVLIYNYDESDAVYNLDASFARTVTTTEEETEEEAEDIIDIADEDEEFYSSSTYTLISCELDGSNPQAMQLDSVGSYSSSARYWDSYMNNVQILADGSICAVVSLYSEVYADEYSEEEYDYVSTTNLMKWNADGSLAWSQNFDDLGSEDEYFYVDTMGIGSDDSLYVLLQGSYARFLVYDGEGNFVEEMEIADEAATILSNAYYSFFNSNGTITLISYNDDWTAMNYYVFDLQTGTCSDPVDLPDTFANYNIYYATDDTFYLTGNNGLYRYTLGSDEGVVQIMNTVNSDLNSSWLYSVCYIDEDRFVASYYDSSTYDEVIAVFTAVDPETIPDKKVIVFGCEYLSSSYRKQIVEFNKNSDEYRITIKDYSEYETMDDYMAGYTQMNLDILAGDMPDILVVDNSSTIPVDSYISKGLIADIGALIDADEEMSRDDYLENVFEAFSVDGVLYYVVPYFYISTVMGKTSLVGDRTGWTMAEFMEVYNSMPEGTAAFSDLTRSDFLSYIITYCGTDFINLSTGECSFDSDDFIQLLEFAATLPEEIDYSNYDWDSWYTTYMDETTLLTFTSIADLSYLKSHTMYYFGYDDVSYVGFPTESGNGSVIYGNYMLVLSAKSDVLDGAWEFVRYYLTDEYQSSLSWGLPVKLSAFETLVEESMQKPYYYDNDGNKVEYDMTTWINDESVVVDPLTQEEADKLVSFIKSVNRRSYSNDSVLSIIEEETASFFDGQKTAEEVADIIQNRVYLYVNE